jgi:hypothetical protein
MPSFKWITHNDKKILYIDIASQNTNELMDISGRIKKEVNKQPADSVRIVCNVKDGKTNNEINEELKALVKYIDPFVKMIVVTGMGGLQNIVFSGLLMFTKTKKLTSKSSEKEAMDFLAGL